MDESWEINLKRCLVSEQRKSDKCLWIPYEVLGSWHTLYHSIHNHSLSNKVQWSKMHTQIRRLRFRVIDKLIQNHHRWKCRFGLSLHSSLLYVIFYYLFITIITIFCCLCHMSPYWYLTTWTVLLLMVQHPIFIFWCGIFLICHFHPSLGVS